MLRYPNARLLPLTIGVTATLLSLKTVSFGWDAFARQASSPSLPSAAAASAPASQPAPSMPSPPSRTAAAPPRDTSDGTRAPSGTDHEWSLLQDLRTRRHALDAREAALDARAEALDAAKASLKDQLTALSTLQASLKGLEATRHERSDGAWMGLVKVYEAMRPADAAGIFDTLDIHVLLEIVDRMNDRKAAAVLAAMTPERARLATQMLARLRVQRIDQPDLSHPT